jgi:hypothetical protein
MSGCARNALSTAKEEGWGGRMVPEMVDYFTERFAGK